MCPGIMSENVRELCLNCPFQTAVCNEMEEKWAYELMQHPEDRENWLIWREGAFVNFMAGKTLPYYGILDGMIICEATAVLYPEAAQHGEKLIDDHTAYLCAFRTNDGFRGKGWFSRLFRFMLYDLRQRGYRKVTVGVEPEDLTNKAIYAHYGFNEYIMTDTELYPDGTAVSVEYYAKTLLENRGTHLEQDG